MSVRITGGAFAGRLLLGPPRPARGSVTSGLRPTAARLRKSLFEVISGELKGVTALDVCAGVGTLGFEALSRGARRVLFLERNRRLAARIADNAARLDVSSFRVLPGDAAQQLRRLERTGTAFDGAPGVVFFDPPWADFRDGSAYRLLEAALRIGPAFAAVEHEAAVTPRERIAPSGCSEATFFRERTIVAGDGAVSLYRPLVRDGPRAAGSAPEAAE